MIVLKLYINKDTNKSFSVSNTCLIVSNVYGKYNVQLCKLLLI